MSGKYDDTISESKDESLMLAIDILMKELESYKPEVKRPNISFKKVIKPHLFFLGIYFCVIILSLLFIDFLGVESKYILIPIIVVIITILIRLKKSVIDAILIYQQYAPDRVRSACVFTPSCSEYMILAINKYGLLVGVIKGIGRLMRCHYPNYGEDEP